jgi:hypothetical protein
VDALHQQPYIVSGFEFETESMRAFEFKNRKVPDDQKKNLGTISVQFMGSFTGKKYIGEILETYEDPVNGQYTQFGHEEIAEVVIKVRAKQETVKGSMLHPRYISEAIMTIVLFRVRKYWNRILVNWAGSIDVRRGYVKRDLTPFIQSDQFSERMVRLWIRHEESWNFTEDTEKIGGEETKGFLVDAKSELNTDDWEYVFIPKQEVPA